MKLFKKLATLVMALALCVGVGATVACGGDNKKEDKGYTFKVLNADGTPAVGYSVQLCKTDGSCLEFVAIDEDGEIFYALEDTSISYELHILDASQNQVEFKGGLKTIPADYDDGVISIKLAK